MECDHRATAEPARGVRGEVVRCRHPSVEPRCTGWWSSTRWTTPRRSATSSAGSRACTRPTRCSGSPKTPGVWPRPLAEPRPAQMLDGLYDLGVAAEAWRSRRFPELAPRADDPRRRLPARRVPRQGAARRADPLGPLGQGRARLRRADRRRGRVPRRQPPALALGGRRPASARSASRRPGPPPPAARATRIPATRSARSSSSAATPGSPSASSRTR